MTPGHQVNALTPTDLGALLGGAVPMTASAPIEWSCTNRGGSAWVGSLPVSVRSGSFTDTWIKMGMNAVRRDHITLALLTNRVAAFRVCLNGGHKGQPPGHHAHRYIPRSGREEDVQVTGFSNIRLGGVPSLGDYASVLQEFADLVNVTVSGQYWTNPGEEDLWTTTP